MRSWLKALALTVLLCGPVALGAYWLTPAGAQQAPNQYPITNSSGNKAATTATATLTPSTNALMWISGFEITAGGSTAANCVTATVTGVIGGTMTYVFCVPAGVGVPANPLVVLFQAALPAASVSTPIVVSLPALGSGNTNAAVVAHGFQMQ